MGIRKTYILDTNVLIHDPNSIFQFHENEIVIPFEVLEELDALKKRYDQIGHNARQVIRYLGDIVENGSINEGVVLNNSGLVRIDSLFLENGRNRGDMKEIEDGLRRSPDNRIIALAYLYKQRHNGNTVFVSKDINARIKAKTLGIASEDYKTDKIDISSIYTGHASISVNDEVIDELHANGEVNISGAAVDTGFFENQFLLLNGYGGASCLAVFKGGRLRKINNSNTLFWGIKPRNKEQQFAVQLLTDNTVHAVTLVGQAGTGKTILALAVGLHKVLEEGVYQRIFITKPVVPVGKQDIGFLPGDKEDKMLPWVQSIFDNFASLSRNNQKLTLDYLKMAHLIEIESIAHIRGRSIAHSWIIVDESQNLTPHEVKTVLSRVGEGSKIVLTGDLYQIDSPYLDAGSNGLSYLVSRFCGQSLYGHMMLGKTIRSVLSSLAAELL